MREYRTLFWIMGASLLVRLILMLVIAHSFGEQGFFSNDSSGFYDTAQNILAGHGFSMSDAPPFLPEAHFPPLYPLLVAGSLALAHSVIPLIILQSILGSLLCFFIWHIARILTPDRRVAIGASLLAGFEPQMLLWNFFVITEVTAVFFLAAAVYFFLKLLSGALARDAALAALFLALSTLIRPHGQFLFLLGLICLVGAALWQRRMQWMKTVLVFAMVFIVIVSPWVARNWQQFHTVSIASTGLRNVYSDFANSVLQLSTGKPFNEVREDLYRDIAKKYGVSQEEIFQNPVMGGTLAREGFAIIRAHPKDAIKVVAISLQAFFTQDLYLDYARRFHLIPYFSFGFSPSVVLTQEGPLALVRLIKDRIGGYAIIPVAGRVLWITIDFLALAGVWYACKIGGAMRRGSLVLLLLVIYFASVSMVGGFADQGRFRYPAASFLFILASIGFWEFRERRHNLNTRYV